MPINPQTGLWQPDLAGKQLEVFNAAERYLLVSGPRWSGKCIGASSIVRTADGLKRIGRFAKLKPNQTRGCSQIVKSFDAIAHRFVDQEAIAIYRDPHHDGLRITTEMGYSIDTSHWHPLWCCVNGQLSYLRAHEIRFLVDMGAKVWLPVVKALPDWQSDFKTINKQTIDNEMGYFLGLLVGHGGLSEVSTVKRVSFSNADSEIIDWIVSFTRSRFGIPFGPKPSKSKAIELTTSSRILVRFLNALGLNSLSKDKRLPDALIESPMSVVRAFLQGLFDTGGCSTETGYIEYCTASRSLALDVQQLLLVWGIIACCKYRPNPRSGAYHIYIESDAHRFYSQIGFRLARKQERRRFLPSNRKSASPFPHYPPEIKQHLRRLYYSRFERGAERLLQRRCCKKIKRINLDTYARGDYHASCEVMRQLIPFMATSSDDPVHSLFLDGNVRWLTVKTATPAKVDLYDLSVPTTQSFIANGFINHNTRAICHRVIRHMWETDGARVAVFAKTIKSALIGGTYDLMIDTILPEWLGADLVSEHGYKLAFTDGPRMEGATRTNTFKLRNYFGGESELYLFSLDYDQDVEAKVKNTQFSMFYFIELDNFRDRNVFTITKAQLRMMPRVPFEKHQWIGDTNPADDGEDSWIYKLFYRYEHGADRGLAFTKHIKVIEVFIEDNPFLSQEAVEDLKSSYAHDPDLYARYILGKWTRATRDSHFADVFLPNVHVQGRIEDPIPDNWEIIIPTETCAELISGWDLGQTNHSAHIACKRYVGDEMAYDFIDELVSIDTPVSIRTFAEAFMERMDYWEKLLQDTYGRTKIMWRHWSDSSSFDYKSSVDASEEKIVANVSNGRIKLLGIAKPRGSVKKRIDMVRRLLFENRLFVSANMPRTIEMLHGLKRGKSKIEWIVYNDPLKHPFDSFSYLLSGEEPMDIDSRMPMLKNNRPQLVSMPA